MNKDITPYNDKGNPHGVWKHHHNNGMIWRIGNWNDDIECGLWRWYNRKGDITTKVYCI